jgi:hypothetical protein
MAALCDIYVNDAFGTAHRAEATTHGIARFAPVACAGPLLAAELDALGKALHAPRRPLVAIVAGSKVSTKLTILKSLADKVDQLIVGGGIANTFLLAAGKPIGKSLAEADLVDEAREIIDAMARRGASVPLPIDVVVASEFSAQAQARTVRRRCGRRRRHDPRHRPAVRRACREDHRRRRHHRLERPGRRVRVRRSSPAARVAWRRRSLRRRGSPSPAAATRLPRSPSSASPIASATSPPAAAPSSSSSKATLPAVAALERAPRADSRRGARYETRARTTRRVLARPAVVDCHRRMVGTPRAVIIGCGLLRYAWVFITEPHADTPRHQDRRHPRPGLATRSCSSGMIARRRRRRAA